MPAAAAHQKPPVLPQPHRSWTDDLLEWKINALEGVLEQLQHLCSSPNCRPKSFSLLAAVQHVVAATAEPESGLGLHLQHMLTGAIAHEITRRADLLADFHKRFPANDDVSPAFLAKYVNSRWWCEVFCQIEATRCRDLMEAVQGAITGARAELR